MIPTNTFPKGRRFRHFPFLASNVILSACSAITAPEPYEPVAAAETLPQSDMTSENEFELGTEAQPEAATSPERPPPPLPIPKPYRQARRVVSPSDLVGLEFSAVRNLLREPDAVRNYAPSIAWIYENYDCVLHLYFYPDLQSEQFRLLKFDMKLLGGQDSAKAIACMRQSTGVRNDAVRAE